MEDLDFTYGDDSLPLMAMVGEEPPSHWGKLTSEGRTCSAAYLKFLGKKDDDVHETPPAG